MSSSKNSDYSQHRLSYLCGELFTAAYMVSRGVKPVYSMAINKQYWYDLIQELESCLETYDLYYVDEYYDVNGTEYVHLLLFKHPYLERIIRFSNKFKGAVPIMFPMDYKDFIAFREWVNGKLFGYGDAEIGEHIEKFLITMYGDKK